MKRTTTGLVLAVTLLPSAVALFGCSNLESERSSVEALAAQRLAREQALQRFAGLAVTVLPSQFDASLGKGRSDTQMASRQAPLRDVMMTLFKDSGINLLIDEDVQGEASFDIKNATAEASFEALLRSYDLAYHWDGNFLRIARHDKRTFDIDFPLPGQGGAQGQNGGGAAGGGSSTSGGGVGVATGAGGQPGASVWDSLQQDLGVLANGDADHRLIVNETLGTVMVEARPSTIQRIADYVQNLRRRAARQVSIEARVLEVALNDAFRAGVDLSVLPDVFNASSSPLANGSTVSMNNAAGVSAFQLGIIDVNQFSVVVDALEQQGQVRVLSSPRISTLNNMMARIRVVEQVPVIEREVIDSEAGTRTEFSVRFEEAGVAVDVTPQIGTDGTITCRIRPSITEVSGFVETPDRLIREPILNTRSLNTTLRVRDGQPIVLGGLRGKRSSEDLDKVPLLGDIPLLGALFRKTSQSIVETELVIVMMPRILTPAWQQEDVIRGTERVVELRRDYALTSLRRLTERSERWWTRMLGGKARVPEGSGAPGAAVLQAGAAGTTSKTSEAASKDGLSRLTLANASFRRAVVALRRGERTEGNRRIAETLAFDPDHGQAWLLRGVLALRDGQPERARRCLEQSLKRLPNEVSAQCNLGLAYLRTGNAKAARDVLRRASLRHSMPEIANNLGVAMMADGDLPAAQRQFERALTGNVSMLEARLNLAVCLDRLGESKEAVAHYRRFVATGGSLDDPRVRGLRERIAEATGGRSSWDVEEEAPASVTK